MSAGAPDYLRCSSARVVRLMNSDVRALEWCASRTPMFERRSGAPDCEGGPHADSAGALIVREVVILIVTEH